MLTFLSLPIPFWLWLLLAIGAGLWTFSAIVASRQAREWKRQRDYWFDRASEYLERLTELRRRSWEGE